MYLTWSFIYFCFVLTKWILSGVTTNEVIQYLHHALVFSTYPTIWFLPALWVGVSMVYFCLYKFQIKDNIVLILAVLLYIIGALEYSYHGLNSFMESVNNGYTSIFVTWRNGVFNGFIYAFIGYKIAIGKGLSLKYSIVGSVFFAIAFLAEALILKRFIPTSDANFLFMLVPFSYFFFSMICNVKLPNSSIYIFIRKLSLLIFVSQRLFLTAIPSVVVAGMVSGPWDITNNGIIALAIVVTEVCLFSYLLIIGSRKIKIMKYLM